MSLTELPDGLFEVAICDLKLEVPDWHFKFANPSDAINFLAIIFWLAITSPLVTAFY
jgi:hypothetical protein